MKSTLTAIVKHIAASDAMTKYLTLRSCQKEGTLMEATLVEARVRRPAASAGLGAKSPTDPDGDWTRSGRERRSHFGYKVHLGVEAGTGLVRRAVLTLAKVYESEVAETW